MADFDKLKQMDIEEIHRKTRITLVRLHDILDKKFDNIDPTRAHGFIKILERELQLDLSEWVKEYDEYKQINTQKDPNVLESDTMQTEKLQSDSTNTKISSPQVSKQDSSRQDFGNKDSKLENTDKENPINTQQVKSPKSKQQTTNNKQQLSSMNIEISMPKQQVSYKTLIIAVSSVSVVLLVAFGIYFVDSNNTQASHVAEQNNTQKRIVEKDIKQAYPTISLYDALNDNEEKREQIATKNNEAKNIDQTQGKDSKEQDIKEDSKIAQQEVKQDSKNTKEITLTITPKQDVWFAWVDTITKMRGEKYTKKTPITLTIKNPTIFHFGYAVLSIEANGQTFEYNQRGVTYMLYDKESGMKLITQKEYKALGGK
ncbi:MAG: hypothetical protein SPJ16_09410 [Helicobacter sp.]|uniref:hypothetical protein n=1 Tax=Helicobacter sp. TaxID=218 RepID=UPI002A90AC8E|nr:hypothetical protein [Helicobacter sp.]MDY5951392.1 hypothetical protein [Helicobacter sp.]